MNIVIVLEMPVLEAKCERKRSLRLPAPLRRQVQKSSSSNTRSKTPGRWQIEWRRRTGSGTRLVSTMNTAVVPGILNRLLEELVICVWLLRGAASHEKRLPTQFASSSVISITIITVWPEILAGNLFWRIGGFESNPPIFHPPKTSQCDVIIIAKS